MERFNSTLINMLSNCYEKKWKRLGQAAPIHLVFLFRNLQKNLHFIYCMDVIHVFHLSVLLQCLQPHTWLICKTYRTVNYLSDAWSAAKRHITHAQDKQKQQYDKHAKESPVKVGDRVMVHMPGSVKGKAWKLVRPYHGPYRVISITPTNAEVRLVDEPGADALFVSLSRVRPCYSEIADVSWSGSNKPRKKNKKETNKDATPTTNVTPRTAGPVTRSMTRLAREQEQQLQSFEDKLPARKGEV